MLDAKYILDPRIGDDYLAIAGSISSAYGACDDLFSGNIVLGNFQTAIQQRSNLLNSFVEHALASIVAKRDGFFYEFGMNQARNYWHLRLHKERLTITSHFIGRNSDRGKARSANCRAVLAARNLDLFDDPTESVDSHVYCHLLHGGFVRPEYICLAIPTHDQSGISHVMSLPLLGPKPTEKEQIREEMIFKLLSQAQGTDDTQQAG